MTEPLPPAPVRRPRVVLIDDDAGVRRSLQLLLHWRGFDVRSFGTAAPVLSAHAADDTDVLITDYLLPDSDGIAVLETLRGRGWRGRAILITAFPSAALIERARASGFVALLEKPIQQHAVIATIGVLPRTP
ncbi:response regulator [Sphingomonas sp. PB2P19]|uniref:response regulator n=1 Tax=Sphingomonas rhamnosi TaxID=3096156 RepID=UPI002FC87CF8